MLSSLRHFHISHFILSLYILKTIIYNAFPVVQVLPRFMLSIILSPKMLDTM